MLKSNKTVVAVALAGTLGLLSSVASAQMSGCPGYADVPRQHAPVAEQGIPCNPGCAQAFKHPHFRGPACDDFAQPHGPDFRGPAGRPAPAPKMAYEDRLTFLAGALDLSDAQKPAWKAYTAALNAVHTFNQEAKTKKVERPETRQGRLEARVAALQARLDLSKAVLQTRTDLIRVLNPEQVKVLEDIENRAHPAPRGSKAANPERPMPPQNGPHHGQAKL